MLAQPFDIDEIIKHLKHYLPAQAPLKDFIHHNSLHAFQHQHFFKGLKSASDTFGYMTYMSLGEFRSLYKQGRISKQNIERVLANTPEFAGGGNEEKLDRILNNSYDENKTTEIGVLREEWKNIFHTDLETFIQPLLFRILCSYLDQGISIWDFPEVEGGFLTSMRELESNSYGGFLKSKKAKALMKNKEVTIENLLDILVGDPQLYEQYIFDQQFAHQGWAGMVSTIEDFPSTLLIPKKITLKDVIFFELILEIDILEIHAKNKWKPLAQSLKKRPMGLFRNSPETELDVVMKIWQQAFEWSFYDQVLVGIQQEKVSKRMIEAKSFQAVFCIDDRECSMRRYIESFDANCETFGTPGFFGVEFYFQPQGGKFYTKVCPAPVTPKYLIKEIGIQKSLERDIHFSKRSHSFLFGWFIAQTIGFWSAFKLLISIFKPTMGPATASSLKHMDKFSSLTVENHNLDHKEQGLQVGFSIDEMSTRVENVLKSIGMVKDFAPIVYIIGHGASSVNNPHYAAYDCGACSGRAGSVNARVFSYMANHTVVRERLQERGISIPTHTQFVGGLQDTTRDEIIFFDEDALYEENAKQHQRNVEKFAKALDYNAKERSRRFISIDTKLSPEKIHQKILSRSVSLFEPRPELNHATNALCIIGRRELSKGVFLDRRAFLNSYDYSCDREGNYLLNILNAAAPVCGGINLEYYFSRVDNQKLGAGTKLPHNVMSLIGVANGIDGDLRPGLPSQMIEVHDPLRLLMVVEQMPEVVLNVIQRNPATYEWFINEWIILTVVHPENKNIYLFKDGAFTLYEAPSIELPHVRDIPTLVESHQENFPVYLIDQA